MPEYIPRYKWRATWPDEPRQDFVGEDEGEIFGRIRLDTTTHNRQGMWMWNSGFSSWIKKRVMPQSGWAETAREASRMVEEHYERLKAENGR
jgi:hypothetical protein